MSALRMGSVKVGGVKSEDLLARTDALESALESGNGQLDARSVSSASAVVDKVRERTGLSGNHTVVAFAGATGSGKSSLFNAVAGAQVATIGARRPTTSTPSAAVWGDEDAAALLDWLQVGARHQVPAGSAQPPAGSLDGLVLLDLPDFDSREVSHHEEAERILALVDVFVWVTDPQKYADARMHDDYVKALATHEAVTMVVLNQVDRLTSEQGAQCAADLKRLLVMDGIPDAPVIQTAATTGAGVDDLRQRLANSVAGRTAARTRLAADVSAAASSLLGGVAPAGKRSASGSQEALVDALSRAAGIPTVVAAVDRDYRHSAAGHTGWPFTRWVRKLRPAPLARLRLDQRTSAEVPDEAVREVLGRSSLPAPTPAARAAVELATRQLVDATSSGLPTPWADAVHDAARPTSGDLTDALDRAVVGTNLEAPSPTWWRLVGVMQLLLAVVAVVGLLWLVVLSVMGWLQLPEITTPRVGWFPVPLLLLVGGLVLGLLLTVLARPLARVGARRRAGVMERRLHQAVAGVARERIVAPVDAVVARHDHTRELLEKAAAR